MEKHNTHILLESYCSDQHDYEEDENGNLKIETIDDIPYHSFVKKKQKLSIKDILEENNNLFKQQLEKEKLTEELLLKNHKKKKKKTDINTNANEYYFDESQIKPCFNEIDIKYYKDKYIDISYNDMDKQNTSQEIKKPMEEFNDDINNEKNKRKRNTLQNLKHKNIKRNGEKNEIEPKNNNEYLNNNYNNKREITQSDNTSEYILLKDKIEYKENEPEFNDENIFKTFNANNNINNDINSSKNKKDGVLSNERDSAEKNEQNNSKINTGVNNDKYFSDNQETNNEKFLVSKTIKKDENNNIINDNSDDLVLLREKLSYNENEKLTDLKDEEHKDEIKQEYNDIKENKEMKDAEIEDNNINKKNNINNDKEEINKNDEKDENKISNNINKDDKKKYSVQIINKKEQLNKIFPEFTYENKMKDKIDEISEKKKNYKRSSMPNYFRRTKFTDLYNDNNINIKIKPTKKEKEKENNEENKSINLNNQNDNEINFDENINSNYNYNKSNGKIQNFIDSNEKENENNNININNSKDIINKPSNVENDKSRQKLSSTLDFSRVKNNDELSNIPAKLKRNTMNALQYPNDKNNMNNNDKSNDINNQSLNSKNNKQNINNKDFDIDISNGLKNKNDNINFKNNAKFTDDDSNYIFSDDKNIVTPISKYGNRNSKNVENNLIKSETDKFLKIKSDEENKQNMKRMNTEEYLEKNLESDNNNILNKENSEKEESNYNNNIPEISDNSSSNDNGNESDIQVKKIVPNCYINKIRHSDIKINKLIPQKKRVFISKIINPHELRHNMNNADFLSIPIIKKCYISNQHIIQNTDKTMKSKINKYYFVTKIGLKKGENEFDKILNIKKLPKVYRKTDKNTLLSKNLKPNNQLKYSNIIDINNKNNNIEINIKKDKKRNEKISLVSKDKDPYLNNKKNRNSNIIIKQDNKLIKEINNDSNGNNIDISILFSNKEILKKTRKIKKYPSSATKKHKNLVASLYKDLRDINKKLENSKNLKKNYLKIHYDRHVGDEDTCPICLQVKKRGRKSEREKGLYRAFSFRNMNNYGKKALSRLKISLEHKFKDKERNNYLWNNFVKGEKKSNDNNFLSSINNNNNDEDTDFKKKYMQFNGMNRFKKLRRYDSSDNLIYSECFSNKNNNNINLKLNMDKEAEKNHDEINKNQYPVLNNYFHEA